MPIIQEYYQGVVSIDVQLAIPNGTQYVPLELPINVPSDLLYICTETILHPPFTATFAAICSALEANSVELTIRTNRSYIIGGVNQGTIPLVLIVGEPFDAEDTKRIKSNWVALPSERIYFGIINWSGIGVVIHTAIVAHSFNRNVLETFKPVDLQKFIKDISF